MKSFCLRPGVPTLLFLASATALYLLLVLPQTLSLSFYHGEIEEIDLLRQDMATILSRLAAGESFRPPLYPILMHGWMNLFGGSEIAMRSFSLLFTLLAIPLLYATANSIQGSPAAWFAVCLYVTSPFVLLWGRVSGWFPMMGFWILLSNLALLTIGKGGSRALIYALSLLFALYTSYYGLALLPAHLLFVLFFRRKAVFRVGAAWLLALVGFLPWLPAVLRQISLFPTEGTFFATIGTLKTLAYTGYAFNLGESLLPSHVVLISAFAVAMLCVCLAAFKGDAALASLLTLQVLAVLAVGMATRSLQPYRAYPFVTPYLLLLAIGFGHLCAAPASSPFRRRLLHGTLLLAFLPAWCLSTANLLQGKEFFKMGMLVPWRQVHAHLSSVVEKDDLVVHPSVVFSHYLRDAPLRGTTTSLDGFEVSSVRNARRVYLIQVLDSYHPPLQAAYERVIGQLQGSCRLVRRHPFLRDPDWRIKSAWAERWTFSEDKLVLLEFEPR